MGWAKSVTPAIHICKMEIFGNKEYQNGHWNTTFERSDAQKNLSYGVCFH